MRNKDYFTLAKRSLRENKKSFSSSIFGMATGFIILIPLIVVAFAVNVNMMGRLDKTPYALYAETSMADYRIKTATNVTDGILNLSGNENIGYYLENENISDLIVYEKHGFYGDTEFRLDDGEFVNLNYNTVGLERNYYVVADSLSSSFFPKNLTSYYPEGIFIDGCGDGFSGNGKGQVIVSEAFLERNGLRAEDAAGRELTVGVKENMNLSGVGRTDTEGYICHKYTIAAVVKSSVSNLYLPESNDFSFFSYMNADLFFTDASVYKDGKGVLRPKITAEDGKKALDYEFFGNKEELNKEYMMLGWGITSNRSIDSFWSYNGIRLSERTFISKRIAIPSLPAR